MKKTAYIFVVLALLAGAAWSALITEPSTVFYGKVTGTGGAQPFSVTEGTLEWVIQKADDSEILLRTQLLPLGDGTYSYRMDIPHSVLAYEIDETQGVPLPPTSETNAHASATVDGIAAVFAGPSGATFEAGQATRAATYRLDLEIPLVPEDSDGDGIPDWWEDEYGLDKQDLSDAAGDADGDGLSNLDEYLNGFNPLLDSRIPSLATEELLAFAGCTTGVRLETEDIDSDTTNLVYTLITPPTNGVLRLRNQVANPSDPDLDLIAGAEFTQQDVDNGRLVFVHEGTNVFDGSFAVSVRDEVHDASEGTIDIAFYDADGASASTVREVRRQRAHLTGWLQDAVIWDAVGEFNAVSLAAPSSGMTDQEYASTYVPSFGNERSQIMTGGRNDDVLSGGMTDDVLVGATGSDVLSGGGGADRFIFDGGDLGADVITDFDPEEGDVIDLEGVLAGLSGVVDNYLLFVSDGTNTMLTLNLDGNGSVFTNLVITLENTVIGAENAYTLIYNDDVLAGNLYQKPRVSVTVADAEASENGNNSGSFVLSRTGSLGGSLDVSVSLGGSAANGIDYSAISESVTFAPGVRDVTLTVSPFADSTVEPDETVELVVQSGSSYVVYGSGSSALTIKDLQSVVGIEVLEGMATSDPQASAVILVSRDGQTANSLVARLDIGGSAQNGSDYDYIPAYVLFNPAETVKLINISPLRDGPETVIISVQEHDDYALADVSSARVIIAPRRDSLDAWQDREFAGSTEAPAEFAAADFGGTGIDHLQRYAYGMDPLNPEASRLPEIVFRDGFACVDIFRNPSAVDIEFIIEVSDDMANWDSSASAVVKTTAPEYETSAEVETYRAVSPVIITPKLFMRVRLVYQP